MARLSRIAGLAAAVLVMGPCITYGQHLVSARGIAIGGFTGLSTGLSALEWNPANLLSVKDWEVLASNYATLGTRGSGLTLQSTGLAKRFLNDHAVALLYAPGKVLEFVVPRTFAFVDSNVSLVSTFDQEINYQEPLGIGYAYRFNDEFSAGVGARLIQEKVTDTKYYIDSSSTIRSRIVDYQGTSWSIDVGTQWNVSPSWKLGFVLKNLFKISETQLSEEVSQYRLDLPRFLRLGAGFQTTQDLLIGFDGDTEKRMKIGLEWIPLSGVHARSGAHVDLGAQPIVEAVAFGIGGVFPAFSGLELDASYLKFLSQRNRTGSLDLTDFLASGIKDVEYNPFTSDRISFTIKLNLGRLIETRSRIEHVEIVSDVYPASSMVYAYRPIGKAIIKNISDAPISARVSFFVDLLMDAPTESRPVSVPPGERMEVPFHAIFNDELKSISAAALREGNVYVATQATAEFDDRYQTRLLVRARNDWNGDVGLLKYFVTSDDSIILQFTRSVLTFHKQHLDTVAASLRNLGRARILFDDFAKGLTYVQDPKKSSDFVQYPSETLRLHGGDCDDMTVCYSSLLTSIGISIAFIDVVPPDGQSDAHVYMMFDTGIEARNAHIVTDNPKRYVIRKNSKGNETAWIPLETTVITKGFDQAWNVGAKEYFDDVEIGLGLLKGWVRVVDLQTVF